MRHKTTQSLYAYWNGVRGERIAPKRFEIEPARIGGTLQDTFILERHDHITYRFRLAGTRICERFGVEFRDRNFLDGWSESDRLTLERHLAAVTQRGCAGLSTVEVSPETGTSAKFELLILPLLHANDTIDRLLGCISALDEPKWLGAERITSKRLLDTEIIWPDGRPHAMVERANRQSPFLPRIRSGRIVRQDRRQFRVYDGGLSKSEDDV